MPAERRWTSMTFNLPPRDVARLRKIAAECGVTVHGLIRVLLWMSLRQAKKGAVHG